MSMTHAPFPFHILDEAVSRGERLWLLLDGANSAGPLRVLYELGCSEHYVPLFCRTRYAHLMSVSPLLAEVAPGSPLLRWFLDGHADDAGLLIGSSEPREHLVQNLRRCLDVSLPDGGTGLLRFFDPRIFADLLRLESSGVMKLLTVGMSSFAVCTTDLENVNVWLHGRRISPHQIADDATCALSATDLEGLEEINEKRSIVTHLAALQQKRGAYPASLPAYVMHEKLNGFDLMAHAASHAFRIGPAAYSKACDRLGAMEKKFNTLHMDDLFEIDGILETCTDEVRERCMKILLDTAQPMSARLYACRDLLPEE